MTPQERIPPAKLLCTQCGQPSKLTAEEWARLSELVDVTSVRETYICSRCVTRANYLTKTGNGTPAA